MEVDRKGLEVLDQVNFWLDRDRIVVRTGEESRLDAATRNAVVAFEVDDPSQPRHQEATT